MFIISFRPTLKKTCAVLASIFIIVFALSILIDGSKTFTASKLLVEVVDSDKRVTYINKFGWQVKEPEVESNQIKIPNDFNDVYKKYNEIQKKQGFNLEKYKGKNVMHYSYEVINYNGEKDFVRANILVYNEEIIASDICSLRLDGFMHAVNENMPSK